MDDRYDPNLILGYVEGELIAADRARVEAMLADDPALATLVSDMQRDREALRSARPAEPKADLAEAAMAALERQMLFDDSAPSPLVPTQPTRRFRLMPILTYGGIAAVLALTAAVVFQSLQSGDEPAATLAIEEAPEPGMSLAEATLEAQRRAARGSELADAPARVDSAAEAVAAATELSLGSEALEAREASQASTVSGTPRSASREAARAADRLAMVESSAALALDDAEAEDTKDTTVSDEVTARAVTTPAAVAYDVKPVGSETTATPSLALADVERWRLNDGSSVAWGSAPSSASPDAVARPETPPVQQVTLNVTTANPARSLAQLNHWAVSNRVVVTSPPSEAVASVDPETAESSLFVTDAFTPNLGTDDDASDADKEPRLFRRSEQAQTPATPTPRPQAADPDRLFYADPVAVTPQRLQVIVAPNQVADLVAALTDERVRVQQDQAPMPSWMQWQILTQPTQVEIVIEPTTPTAIFPAVTVPADRTNEIE